jgi:sRNA-binding carbon storage regulator CsrA
MIDERTGAVLVSVMVLELLPGGLVRLGFDADKSVSIVRDNAKRRDGNGNRESSNNDAQDEGGDDDEEHRGNRRY